MVQRNRPRVFLFSPKQAPSLLYNLTAFSYQKVADFAFVSTYQIKGLQKKRLLATLRAPLVPGIKQLSIFKDEEELKPALSLKVSYVSSTLS